MSTLVKEPPPDVRLSAPPRAGRRHAASAHRHAALPPVILLGGDANALSVARDLRRLGDVQVHALTEPGTCVGYSRHCRRLPVESGSDLQEAWSAALLGSRTDHLTGAVLLACSDDGIEVLLRQRAALMKRFRLDLCEPAAQRTMLDKLRTYEAARAAGVATPRFWTVSTRDELLSLRRSLVFPLLVKPRLSHVFQRHFRSKHLVASCLVELLRVYDRLSATNLDLLLCEYIPGGDDQLCSYFTYIDEHGEPLFHFTKRVIRRYPVGMGAGTYHIVDPVPQLPSLALPLLRQTGLRGLANVEFKLDRRDGQYKLIECNARFAGSNALLSRSGCNLAALVYSRLAGLPAPPMNDFRAGLRQWDPLRDLLAFRELRKAGHLSTVAWLRSILHRQMFPYFRWSDPMPSLARLAMPAGRALRRIRPVIRRPPEQPVVLATMEGRVP